MCEVTLLELGFRVKGSDLRVSISVIGVWRLGFWVWGFGAVFEVGGVGFDVLGFGFGF